MNSKRAMLLNNFIVWFNRNVKGETVITASPAVIKRRSERFLRVYGITESRVITDLAADIDEYIGGAVR